MLKYHLDKQKQTAGKALETVGKKMKKPCMHIKEDDSYTRQVVKFVYIKDTNVAIMKAQIRK